MRKRILEQAKLWLVQRQFQEAECMLRRATAKDPTNYEALNLLGVSLEMKGLLTEAAQFYRAALSFGPSYVPAQRNLHRATRWAYDASGLAANLKPGPDTEA
ncbi:MAG TPA: tetratricopeptide repeat protein [Symbiobacteriaceae bacterium]|nr:tetratricopeptide repeat protein [Symbiobacteriaceae bacterium]